MYFRQQKRGKKQAKAFKALLAFGWGNIPQLLLEFTSEAIRIGSKAAVRDNVPCCKGLCLARGSAAAPLEQGKSPLCGDGVR